jgi:hypothetical protein
MLSRFIWLIGVHVEGEDKTYSFYADGPKQEKEILTEVLDFLRTRPHLNLISYSGFRMERRMPSQKLAAHRLPTDAAQSIRDIYFHIYGCIPYRRIDSKRSRQMLQV